MKKAGLSGLKSNKKNSAQDSLLAGGVELHSLAHSLAVGHTPPRATPQDEALFKAFQANLLSMVSHELRTPLMGVLNGLTLLENSDAGGLPMARRGAEQLRRTLEALLDLAALESGTFHAQLREVDLGRLVIRTTEAIRPLWKGRRIVIQEETKKAGGALCLVDPQKMSRAIDLCMGNIFPFIQASSACKIRISTREIIFDFLINKDLEQKWDLSWTQSLAAHQGGVSSPGSLFTTTIRSEKDFLSRGDEGLGNDWTLVHEILKLHGGRLELKKSKLFKKDLNIHLIFSLPEKKPSEILKAILSSRMGALAAEPGGRACVSLGLIGVPKGFEIGAFSAQVKEKLFRTSDSLVALPEGGAEGCSVALVMDDCKPQDAPKLLRRLERSLKCQLRFGVSSSPSDGLEPEKLIRLAKRRLRKRL